MGWRPPWEAKPGSPGTAHAVKPEMVDDDAIPHLLRGFKDGIKWTRGSGQEYRRTNCLQCGEDMGTCQGSMRFKEIKMDHRRKCRIVCGFPDCVDCDPRFVCSCTFSGGFIIQCATCDAKPGPWVKYNAV